jgi:Fe-S cluster biogenesis protein NfuA/nitrite reductase/ring-hydroxylating ferredoxin subunit
MANSFNNEFERNTQRIEMLIHEIEGSADPATRSKAKELVQLLMDLHGTGLERIMDILSKAGEPGRAMINAFTRDDLVKNVLLLYSLHTIDLGSRVLDALDKVRPYLNSHGGNVELLGVDEREGIVRLRLQGSCKSCPSSSVTLKLAIEEAIYEACPDVTTIEAEGGVEQSGQAGFVKFKGKSKSKEPSHQSLINGDPPPSPIAEAPISGGWQEVNGLESLSHGSVRTVEVSGCPILFCRVGENLYAYSDTCPACSQSLGGARISATALTCPSCGQTYDIIRAGRGLDQPSLHLEPFPLLIEKGRAKVALPVF